MLSAVLTGCATLDNLSAERYKCALSQDGQHLTLSGPTDEKMLSCVQENTSPKLTAITVNSNGGNVETAIKAAKLLAENDLTITVKANCNSSCANYFLPIARQIVLQKNSKILLHGSIDEGLIAKAALEAENGKAPEWGTALVRTQSEFAKTHRIHPGWLLYRTAEDYANRAQSQYVKGRPEVWADDGPPIKMYLVEETFFKSCLQHVIIGSFENTRAAQIYTDEAIRKSYLKQGIYPTGLMRCEE
mgnify:CR=1 FL=1